MKPLSNKDRILKISDKDRGERYRKILSTVSQDHEIQSADVDGYDVKNIIIPANHQKRKIVLMAHWDVFPGSAGLNDNSTGVVTLLKLQRCLPDDVEIVFTDREECGGRGCQAYLDEQARKKTRPRMAINVDVVGLGDKIFFEKYGDPKAINTEGVEMEAFDGIPFSDSHILRRAGVPNILLLTGPSKRELIGAIFKAQHCGPDDGRIELISEDVMDRVFGTVKKLIQNNSNQEVKRYGGRGTQISEVI